MTALTLDQLRERLEELKGALEQLEREKGASSLPIGARATIRPKESSATQLDVISGC